MELRRPGCIACRCAFRAGDPAVRDSIFACTCPRLHWNRFIRERQAHAAHGSDLSLSACRLPMPLPMDPLLLPEAIALIDRHYISLLPYRPDRANLYAVREGSHLTL